MFVKARAINETVWIGSFLQKGGGKSAIDDRSVYSREGATGPIASTTLDETRLRETRSNNEEECG